MNRTAFARSDIPAPRVTARRNYEEISTLDAEERDRLVMEHLPLVRYIAKRIHERLPQHVLIEDLIHTGVVGLLEGLRNFDPTRNVQHKTYVKIRVEGAILDSLRELDWGPRSLRKKARALESAQQKLRAALGEQPSEADLAAELGIELPKLQQLLCDLRGLKLGSLEALEESGHPEARYNYMPDAPGEDPLYQCLHSELHECLTNAVAELPERERQVLALYYVEELTMREVGAVLGLAEARISQIHSAALIRLRARMKELLEARPTPANPGENADD